MSELEHGWKNVGTSAQEYYVADPIGGVMREVGLITSASPDDDIRFKQTGPNTIELYNASEGTWWAAEWNINSWIITDTQWIGPNANF